MWVVCINTQLKLVSYPGENISIGKIIEQYDFSLEQILCVLEKISRPG